MPEQAQLAQLYGPLAAFSDYKRGETISYWTVEGERRRGEILWVCSAGDVVGVHVPLQYIVACGTGFPDVVMAGDILPEV